MKDRIYLVSPQFVEEKVKKIFDLSGEIGLQVARMKFHQPLNIRKRGLRNKRAGIISRKKTQL
jgi:hypothetical protein